MYLPWTLNLPVYVKIDMAPSFFIKFSNMKFHENNFSDFWNVNICTDKQTEIAIGSAQVCEHA